ncbi:MAG: hypothetical protein EON58_18920, partial [Alphaproteobacteria bacterium]
MTQSDKAVAEDETYKKIGRNLVLLQGIEELLKSLLMLSSFELGKAETVKKREAGRRERIRTSPLGLLVQQLKAGILGLAGPSQLERAKEVEHEEVGFKFSFSVEQHDAHAWSERLDLLVHERNELTHHLLRRWDRASVESTDKLNEHLDAQRTRALLEFERLRELRRSALTGLQVLSRFISSPEGVRYSELAWLQTSPLIQRLIHASSEAVANGGWVSLASIGRGLWAELPEEMMAMKDRYGYRKLSTLLVASKLFQFENDGPSAHAASDRFKFLSEGSP